MIDFLMPRRAQSESLSHPLGPTSSAEWSLHLSDPA